MSEGGQGRECGKEGVSEAPMAMPRSGHQWACMITCPGHHKDDKDDEDDEDDEDGENDEDDEDDDENREDGENDEHDDEDDLIFSRIIC